jgi:hypothetical protein
MLHVGKDNFTFIIIKNGHHSFILPTKCFTIPIAGGLGRKLEKMESPFKPIFDSNQSFKATSVTPLILYSLFNNSVSVEGKLHSLNEML